MYLWLRNNPRVVILTAISLLVIAGCARNDKKLDPSFIYFDYTITGEEDNDSITVMLQYRDGEGGEAVSIGDFGNVTLDGDSLPTGSTKVTGPYYEIQKPLTDFLGKHTIAFTVADNQSYKEEFMFQPLQLVTALPDSIPPGELVLELAGVEQGDMVRVLLTDTVFGSEGIDRLDTIHEDNRLVISEEDMAEFTPGPIQLELVKESEKPIEKGTDAGGRIYMSFRLRREFHLTRQPD